MIPIGADRRREERELEEEAFQRQARLQKLQQDAQHQLHSELEANQTNALIRAMIEQLENLTTGTNSDYDRNGAVRAETTRRHVLEAVVLHRCVCLQT